MLNIVVLSKCIRVVILRKLVIPRLRMNDRYDDVNGWNAQKRYH